MDLNFISRCSGQSFVARNRLRKAPPIDVNKEQSGYDFKLENVALKQFQA